MNRSRVSEDSLRRTPTVYASTDMQGIYMPSTDMGRNETSCVGPREANCIGDTDRLEMKTEAAGDLGLEGSSQGR